MIFDQKDTRAMLHTTYVMEELAWAMDYLPMAPSQEALAAMYGDVCPCGPTPPEPDWTALGAGVEYAAGNSAWLHEQYGREALVAEREYYEQLERDMDAELQEEPRRWV